MIQQRVCIWLLRHTEDQEVVKKHDVKEQEQNHHADPDHS